VSDDKEFLLDPRRERLVVGELTPEPPRYAARGAAHESFTSLFSLPFHRAIVEEYPDPCGTPEADKEKAVTAAAAAAPAPPPADKRSTWKKPVAITLWSVSAAALATGIGFSLAADSTYDSLPERASQIDVLSNNDSVAEKERIAAGFYAGAAVTALTGTVLYLWGNKRTPSIGIAPLPRGGGGTVGWTTKF
jgi:hypothetical protein